jgi:hypothetical protein
MTSKRALAIAGLLAAVFGATSASAQTSGPGVRGYGVFGSTFLTSDRAVEAVGGGDRQLNIGGGVQLVNVWKSVFADLSVSKTRITGERVFIDGDTVYRLGIPLEVTLRPIDVAVGWRAHGYSRRTSTYIGAGLSHIRYEETSRFAQPGDDVSDGRTGGMVLFGVDVSAVRWLAVGGEMRYRLATGVVGVDGATAAFSEKDLGGLAASLRLVVGR